MPRSKLALSSRLRTIQFVRGKKTQANSHYALALGIRGICGARNERERSLGLLATLMTAGLNDLIAFLARTAAALLRDRRLACSAGMGSREARSFRRGESAGRESGD